MFYKRVTYIKMHTDETVTTDGSYTPPPLH
jgi:hypothetical protein